LKFAFAFPITYLLAIRNRFASIDKAAPGLFYSIAARDAHCNKQR
jgi:hypothetical protein